MIPKDLAEFFDMNRDTTLEWKIGSASNKLEITVHNSSEESCMSGNSESVADSNGPATVPDDAPALGYTRLSQESDHSITG